jgi:hypothetical protein
MRCEAGVICVAPARQPYHHAAMTARIRNIGRLDDMQSLVVDKISVFAKQLLELCHRRVAIGHRLGLELAECLLDRLRGQFHHETPFTSARR